MYDWLLAKLEEREKLTRSIFFLFGCGCLTSVVDWIYEVYRDWRYIVEVWSNFSWIQVIFGFIGVLIILFEFLLLLFGGYFCIVVAITNPPDEKP